eukprot:TRINITY_DN16173_c0_g1_i1.p1 TRINITY_DN16173_c0_g1~~TRINITY_DN16173_c0_g1_i1.p1  ORF type:complete len:448 (+),score=62.18 TRINITY_DN16173_c0_g1_i1:109-1452(+)
MGGAASVSKSRQQEDGIVTCMTALELRVDDSILKAAIASPRNPVPRSAVPVLLADPKANTGRGRRSNKAFVVDHVRTAKTISDSGHRVRDDCAVAQANEKSWLQPQLPLARQPQAPQKPKQYTNGKRPRPYFTAHSSRDGALGGFSTDSGIRVRDDPSGDTSGKASHIGTVVPAECRENSPQKAALLAAGEVVAHEKSKVDLTTGHTKDGGRHPILKKDDFPLESVVKERCVRAANLESSGLASGIHRLPELSDREQATHCIVQPPKDQRSARLNTRNFASAPSRTAQRPERTDCVSSSEASVESELERLKKSLTSLRNDESLYIHQKENHSASLFEKRLKASLFASAPVARRPSRASGNDPKVAESVIAEAEPSLLQSSVASNVTLSKSQSGSPYPASTVITPTQALPLIAQPSPRPQQQRLAAMKFSSVPSSISRNQQQISWWWS